MKPLFDDISNNLHFHKSMIEILIDYQNHIKDVTDYEIIMDTDYTQLFFIFQEIELI